MEMREEALHEALSNNTQEINRWETFKKENETAIENLANFSKNLIVDVLVPLGSKAFMPGQLIHTNEVLVGHYQGYFSKCSAYKAKQICELRIDRAKDQLEKLHTEAELWQNKLEKPYSTGVLPNVEEQEIIENYDEETEKRWREVHKLSVKQAKLKEKSDRENKNAKLINEKPESGDKDIFQLLEEAEIIEELENELDNLKVDEINDETVKKLLAGQMPAAKQKQRVAHTSSNQKKSEEEMNSIGIVKQTAVEYEILKKPSATIDNTEFENKEDLTEDVRLIKDQAKFLPVNDQIGFYEYQIEIIRKKIAGLRMINEQDIDEKLHLLAVQDELDDLLALAEYESDVTESTNEQNFNSEEEEQSVQNEDDENPNDLQSKFPQKRRISFALEDETLLFRRNEAVSQLLQKTNNHDIIKLYDKIASSANPITETSTSQNKQQQILEKVERSLHLASEHQMPMDCDLITKIIDENNEKTIQPGNTAYIKFQHSTIDAIELSRSENDNDLDASFVPEKPSDFYRQYIKQLSEASLKTESKPTNVYLNSYIGEEKVEVPILREVNRESSYEDPRSIYSNPNINIEDTKDANQTKSILRNKSEVEKEIHLTPLQVPSKKQKKKTPSVNEEEYMSAYNKVMNDVVEKPLTSPEPLPKGKYINANASKKRVSRFKQTRVDMEKHNP